MNTNKMFLSLVPWLAFSVLVHRLGAEAAWLAALVAAGLGTIFLVRGSASGVKLIDLVGVGTFGLYVFACLVGGFSVSAWVADYGRGTAALLLGTIMLSSAAVVPLSEQYAREGVPRQYWATPVFRAVNRKISALWGAILLVMGTGHLMAGELDPISTSMPGPRPTDFLLNWAMPAGLILFGVSMTRQLAGKPTDPTSTEPAVDGTGHTTLLHNRRHAAEFDGRPDDGGTVDRGLPVSECRRPTTAIQLAHDHRPGPRFPRGMGLSVPSTHLR